MNAVATDLNFENEPRCIGVEIEYAGLPLDQAAQIVRDMFGGEIVQTTNALFAVKDTSLGDFKLELDALPLQKVAENTSTLEGKDDKDLLDEVGLHLGKVIGSFGAKIVPFEMVLPPVPISELSKLDELIDKLRDAGALDTKDTFYSAFGLHLNPEAVALDADYLVRHLKSYLLLSPWLKKRHKVDLTRRLTGFIEPFPKSYKELVLDNSYAPERSQLIADYHTHNPSRNRELDMLPLFSFVDEDQVRGLYGSEEKINKRPTFHYRLPNCELANPDWSISLEFSRWHTVEQLAGDTDMLANLIEQWRRFQENLLSFESEWLEILNAVMGKDDGR